MNDEESRKWLNHHRALHSDFANWMRSLDASEIDAFASATESCLRLVEYKDAIRISQQMFDGKIKKPFAYSDHPRVVRENGEPACSHGGSSKQTLEEIEELKKQARQNPLQPVSHELRELLLSIGIMPREKRVPECGPMSGASSRLMKCPYCEGQAIVICDEGFCCDCGTKFLPDGQTLGFYEATLAKEHGNARRERVKKFGKKRKHNH